MLIIIVSISWFCRKQHKRSHIRNRWFYVWFIVYGCCDVRRRWTVVRQTGNTWMRTFTCWLLLRTVRTELASSCSELSMRWRSYWCLWWVVIPVWSDTVWVTDLNQRRRVFKSCYHWADFFKNPSVCHLLLARGEIWQECSSCKCASIDGVCISDIMSDGGHGVISLRKVLPPGECTRSVCLSHMQQRPPVPDP